MAHNGDVKELILAGLVCYTLEASLSGEPTLAAKWVSTRTLRFGETGTGHAVRQSLGVDKSKVPAGFEGSWRIEYYEPDGKLAVTAFLLEIEKKDQVCLLFQRHKSVSSRRVLLIGHSLVDLLWEMGEP